VRALLLLLLGFFLVGGGTGGITLIRFSGFRNDKSFPIFMTTLICYWNSRILFFTIIFPVLLYTTLFIVSTIKYHFSMSYLDHRGRDRMVVFTTTYVIGAYHHWCCGFDSHSGLSIRHYVIKFVIDLRLVGSFLRVLLFPLPIKLTATI
jgi:hypothetical protein